MVCDHPTMSDLEDAIRAHSDAKKRRDHLTRALIDVRRLYSEALDNVNTTMRNRDDAIRQDPRGDSEVARLAGLTRQRTHQIRHTND